jgi:CRISPR-associated protein Csy3
MAKRANSTGLPSHLTYARSIHPTSAAFYAVQDGVREPIRVIQQTALGAPADPMEPAKMHERDYASGNPTRGEVAALPHDCETLEVAFNLTISPSSLAPHACDIPAFRRLIMDYTRAFGAAGGYDELARRYAVNIANGRWAWRNRSLATDFTVEVLFGRDPTPVTFDAFTFNLETLDVPEDAKADIRRIATHIAAGLKGPKLSTLKVRGRLTMAAGSNVWPSQEFTEKSNGTNDVGKTLFKLPMNGHGEGTGYHEQKVGAALRFIDTWHKGLEDVPAGKPLCVNPYGQDRDVYLVVRDIGAKGSPDFYTLLKNRIAVGETGLTDDDYFAVSNLIRGGVFPVGGKRKESKEPDNVPEAED